MKPFPMETLLKVRKLKLKRLQAELEALRPIEKEIASSEVQAAEALSEGNLRLYGQLKVYLDHLKTKQTDLLIKKQEVAEAMRETKVLEKLREKHYSLCHLQETKKETTFLDDVARYQRAGS